MRIRHQVKAALFSRARPDGGASPSLRAIILGAGDGPSLETKDSRDDLIGLRDRPQVRRRHDLHARRYDAIYVPRDASIEVTPGADGCDIAEVSRRFSNATRSIVAYPDGRKIPSAFLQPADLVRSASEHSDARMSSRPSMAGVTFISPALDVVPPHEHAVLAEERTSTSTCPRRRSASSSSTRTRRPKWRPSCAKRRGADAGRISSQLAGPAARSLPLDDGGDREDDDRLFGVVTCSPTRLRRSRPRQGQEVAA